VDGATQYLVKSMIDFQWLQSQFDPEIVTIRNITRTDDSIIVGVLLSRFHKRASTPDCSSDNNTQAIGQTILDVANENLLRIDSSRYNGPFITSSETSDCDIEVRVIPEPDSTTEIIGGVIGAFAAILLIIAVAALFLLSKKKLDLKSLPPDVRWQYERFQENPKYWETVHSAGEPYYRKQLVQHSDEWTVMSDLFYGFFDTSHKIAIHEAYAIYNSTLLSNFINSRKIMTARVVNRPDIFQKQDWRKKKNASSRERVVDKLQSRLDQCNYNETDEHVPILPVVHGTDFSLAMAICSTGFATLSNLDVGWYGAGVYFTTYTMYAMPYFIVRKDPAVIVSFVFLGNTYPVVEHTKAEDNLLGATITPGYNSHYVLLNHDGHVPEEPVEAGKEDQFFDEIVIAQESQIVPVYVIRFETKHLRAIKWDPFSNQQPGIQAPRTSSSKNLLSHKFGKKGDKERKPSSSLSLLLGSNASSKEHQKEHP